MYHGVGVPEAEQADRRRLLFQCPVARVNLSGVMMAVASALIGDQMAGGNIRFIGAKDFCKEVTVMQKTLRWRAVDADGVRDTINKATAHQ